MNKLISLFLCSLLLGCSTVKEAHMEFRKEIDGFRSEWARVILKKDIPEGEFR